MPCKVVNGISSKDVFIFAHSEMKVVTIIYDYYDFYKF